MLLIALAIPPFLLYLHHRGWRLSIRAALGVMALLGIGLLCFRSDLARLVEGQVVIDWPQLAPLLFIALMLSAFCILVLYIFRAI
jgi:hypothetical protein